MNDAERINALEGLLAKIRKNAAQPRASQGPVAAAAAPAPRAPGASPSTRPVAPPLPFGNKTSPMDLRAPLIPRMTPPPFKPTAPALDAARPRPQTPLEVAARRAETSPTISTRPPSSPPLARAQTLPFGIPSLDAAPPALELDIDEDLAMLPLITETSAMTRISALVPPMPSASPPSSPSSPSLEVKEVAVEEAKKLKLGNGLDEGVVVGPMFEKKALAGTQANHPRARRPRRQLPGLWQRLEWSPCAASVAPAAGWPRTRQAWLQALRSSHLPPMMPA